jgi:hypothetical protein
MATPTKTDIKKATHYQLKPLFEIAKAFYLVGSMAANITEKTITIDGGAIL